MRFPFASESPDSNPVVLSGALKNELGSILAKQHQFIFLKMGHSQPLFLYFRLFYYSKGR